MTSPESNETTSSPDGGFEPTEEQRAGARRTAIIIVGLVLAMIALATLRRVLGW